MGRLGQGSFPNHYTYCLREAPGDGREMLNNKDSYYCLQTASLLLLGFKYLPQHLKLFDFGQVTFFVTVFYLQNGLLLISELESCVCVCVCVGGLPRWHQW